MSLLVGEISEITRYPVKSFSGESLESCKVDTYGLYGDHFCAFYDETKEGWDSFITARDISNIHPDTLERDTSLLKRVNEQMNLNFGMYASVKKTGQIQVGQKIYLSN